MSVINQMLRDLQRRQTPGGRPAAAWRAVEPGGDGRAGPWAWLLVCAVVLGWLVYWWRLGLPASQGGRPSAAPRPVSAAVVASVPSPDAGPAGAVGAPQAAAGEVRKGAAVGSTAPAPSSAAKPAATAGDAGVAPDAAPEAAQAAGGEARRAAAARESSVEVSGTSGPRAVETAADDVRPSAPAQDRPAVARPRPETLYRRAQAALAAGREQAAAADLAAALAAKPDFHAAREALIAVALRRGRIAEAERLVDEGLALAPDHLPYARLLAQWQLDRGDAAAARRVLERVMASADPALHAYYAAVLQRLGEWPEAVRHQLLAVEAEPARGAWWLALGWSLEQLQRRRAAAEAYRKGLACQDLTAELRTWAAGRLRSLEDTP